MNIHVLQHVPFEGLGSIESWLNARTARITYTRFFETHQLPALDSADMIVIMGGPMSANDADRFPWLTLEKQYIRNAVFLGIPMLGICLGAQLIAASMGSRVYRNRVREIGWFPVRAVPASEGYFSFPKEFQAFHWHGETFEIPEGGVRLAESDGCDNQAFQLNRNVIGLQFHLETAPESVSALLDNCPDDLVAGPYVQPEETLRAIPRASYEQVNAVMAGVLSYLLPNA